MYGRMNRWMDQYKDESVGGWIQGCVWVGGCDDGVWVDGMMGLSGWNDWVGWVE